MKLITTFTLLLTAAVGASSCGGTSNTNAPVVSNSPTPSATTAQAPPVDTMAAGKKLYSSNCAACHKEDGRGGVMKIEGKSIDPDDLTSEKIKKFSDEKIYGYIYNGLEDEGMPAFKDTLSEAEIREVVRYLRSEIQKMPVTP